MISHSYVTKLVLAAVLVATLPACGSLKKNSATEKGDAGSQGPAGQDGARGPAGAWEVYALKTGKRVGLLMGGIYSIGAPPIIPVQFSDGTRTTLEMTDGTISPNIRASLGVTTTSGATTLGEGATCSFTTTDCTGVCYFAGDATNHTKPAKDVIFRHGQRWFKGTGNETNAGALTSKSYIEIGGTCNQQQQSWGSSYPVGEYTPPADFDYPFGGLDIRANTL